MDYEIGTYSKYALVKHFLDINILHFYIVQQVDYIVFYNDD